MNPYRMTRPEILSRVASRYRSNGFIVRRFQSPLLGTGWDGESRLLVPQIMVMEGPVLVRFIDAESAESLTPTACERWALALGGGVPLQVYVPGDLIDVARRLRSGAPRAVEARLAPLEAVLEPESADLASGPAEEARGDSKLLG